MKYRLKSVNSFAKHSIGLFMLLWASMGQAVTLTGNLLLPQGVTANGDLTLNLTVEVFDDNFPQNTIDTQTVNPTISNGASQAAFTIDFVAAPEFGFTRISFGCDSNTQANCENLLNGVFYSSSGGLTISEFDAQISNAILPSNLNLIVPEGESAIAQVSLGDLTATGDAQIEVTLNYGLTQARQTVTIANGTSNTDFPIVFPTQNSLGFAEYSFSYQCIQNCDGVSTSTYEILNEFVFDSQSQSNIPRQVTVLRDTAMPMGSITSLQRISEDQFLRDGPVLTVFPAQSITGNLNIPQAEAGSTPPLYSIVARTFDSNGSTIAVSVVSDIDVAAGQTLASFSFEVPLFQGANFNIEYGCQFDFNTGVLPCEDFVSKAFYSSTEPVFFASQAELLPVNGTPTAIDLDMVTSQPFTYNAQLQGGVASQNLNLEVEVVTFSSSGERGVGTTANFTDEFVNIPTGSSDSTTTNTFLGLPPLAAGEGSYRVLIFCAFNCADVPSLQYYRPDGNVFSESAAPFPVADLPAGPVTLPIERGTVVTGTVSLPNNSNVSGSLDLRVMAELFDLNGNSLNSSTSFAFLDTSIDSSFNYSLTYPNITDTDVRLSVVCDRANQFSGDCGDIGGRTFYSGVDTTTRRFDEAAIPINSVPATADFEASIQPSVSGQISLPSGLLASEDLTVSISISNVFDLGGFVRSRFLASENVVISNSSMTATYKLFFDEVSSGDYVLQFNCQNCDGVFPNVYFTPDGNRFDMFTSRLDFNQLQSPINVIFEAEQALTGQVQLRSGDTTSAEEIVGVQVNTFDQNGDSVGSAVSVDNQTILSGLNATSYAVSLPISDQIASYEVFAFCVEVCPSFGDNFLFLQSDGSFSNQSALLTLAQIPSVVNFQIPPITLPTVVATIDPSNLSFTTSFNSPDEIWVQVNHPGGFIQLDTIGSLFDTEIGLYDDQGNLLQRDDQSGGNNTSALGDLDLAAGTYFLAITSFPATFGPEFEVSTTASNITNATAIVNYSNQQPANTEVNVSGSISLPFAAPGDVGVNIVINATTADGVAFSTTLLVTIPDGDQSTPFTQLVDAFDQGNTTISYQCVANCQGLSTLNSFFSPDGIRTSASSDTQLSLAQLNSPIALPVFGLFDLLTDITLPAGFPTTSSPIDVQLSVSSFDSLGLLFSSEFVSVTIDAGADITSTDLSYPGNADSISIGFICDENLGNDCGDLLNINDGNSSPFVNVGGGITFNFSESQIPIDQLPANLNIELIEGTRIPLNVSGPATASSRLAGSAMSNAFSAQVQVALIDDQGQRNIIAILSAEGDLNSLLLPPLPNGARYEIEFSCGDGFFADNPECEDLIENSPLIIDQLPSNGDPVPVITLELSPSLATDLLVNFPESMPNSNGNFIEIEAFIAVLDSGQTVFNNRQLFSFNDSSEAFSLELPQIEADQFYEIRFGCTFTSLFRGCDNFIENDPSYTVSFAASAIPNPIEFQLLAAFLVEADQFEDDDTAAQAKPIRNRQRQNHTIHEPGDQDWLRFEVIENDTDIVLTAISNVESGGAPIITLLDTLENEIEVSSTLISQAETDNSLLADIARTTLTPGEYLVRIEHFTPAANDMVYTIRLDINRPSDESLCFPVTTQSGATTLICL